ncbi:hypothetical protein Sjap_005831 [Stephania japonica]|uniref:J domain-containing protein n=1 Tax=Stephania japonica TaxID=461633 RepID=A0AAP0PIC4_9MAGN
MGGDNSRRKHRKNKYVEEASDNSASSFASSSCSSSTYESETSSERRPSSRRWHGRHKDKRRSGDKGKGKGKVKVDRIRKHKRRKQKEKSRMGRRKGDSISCSSENEEESRKSESAKNIIDGILHTFPSVAAELKQLLQMVDDGQAVDIGGISDRALVKNLKKLFASLHLKSSESGVYLLPSKAHPTLEVVGSVISTYLASQEQRVLHDVAPNHEQSAPSNVQCGKTMNELDEGKSVEESSVNDDLPAPRRRLIGPEMPSSELLAAAAKLTEAEAALREAEVEADTDLFIGPPPPAVVAEAESANEAERFEEITRILGVEIENPYDVLGVNWKMSSDNIKKRYWKLSLMVHPDKCSHPQAHQAFVALNKAFKDIQDPDKRKALDDQIRKKEEQEEMKAELQAMREAAQWRKLQGISMAGDEELLAEPELPLKREEWMTTLPPERKAGVSMHTTTSFSRSGKEGRGDTSSWTDTPSEKAQKAKMNYLEAYNEAAALADGAEKKRTNSDAALVDQYNSIKRSKTLVQQHQEERSSKRKVKKEEKKKEEWEGQHPWKPWDREKDLTAGRQKVNLDSENMVQGLSSRFSSGNIQRNFL